MDDFNNLLTRLNRFDYLLADSFGFYFFNKVFNNGQGDIGFKQGNANFAHSCGHILFGQRAAPRQVVKDTREFVA